MSFDDSIKNTGRYQGDYDGVLRHIASGEDSKGGYVVVFEWEDALGGLKGIQTMWFQDDDLSRCQGTYFTFDRDPGGFGSVIQAGNMREHQTGFKINEINGSGPVVGYL